MSTGLSAAIPTCVYPEPEVIRAIPLENSPQLLAGYGRRDLPRALGLAGLLKLLVEHNPLDLAPPARVLSLCCTPLSLQCACCRKALVTLVTSVLVAANSPTPLVGVSIRT